MGEGDDAMHGDHNFFSAWNQQHWFKIRGGQNWKAWIIGVVCFVWLWTLWIEKPQQGVFNWNAWVESVISNITQMTFAEVMVWFLLFLILFLVHRIDSLENKVHHLLSEHGRKNKPYRFIDEDNEDAA